MLPSSRRDPGLPSEPHFPDQNLISTRNMGNQVVCVKFCKMVMASVGGVLLLPRSAGVAEA